MSDLKTKPTDQSVKVYLNRIADEKKRQDCYTILTLMKAVTGMSPQMWGDSIVGFGSYHYRYASGREGDWFLTGFAPRKQALTLYIMAGFDQYEALLEKLGKFKTGKSCLYVKKIDDIDLPILKELIRQSVDHMIETHS